LKKEEEGAQRHTERRQSWDDGGREWNDALRSQEALRIGSKHLKLRKRLRTDLCRVYGRNQLC
jgi:hypothetical protein